MPWLSTPCRSAQDRMSAVASAFSSGMPQANTIALICARCCSYGAGMNGPPSIGAQPCAPRAFRQGCCPSSHWSAVRHQRWKMEDKGAELLRARFGIDLPGVEVPPAIAPLLDRRVVRRYRDEPVPDSLLDALLAAAQAGPGKS